MVTASLPSFPPPNFLSFAAIQWQADSDVGKKKVGRGEGRCAVAQLISFAIFLFHLNKGGGNQATKKDK